MGQTGDVPMTDWWRNELYSQFGEDGLLLSYFRVKAFAHRRSMHDLDLGSGFYIDIGAHHPFMLSNTWYFYQRGWRGINIDPAPGIADEFTRYRPRDVNLQIAIAAEDGEAILYANGRSVHNLLVPSAELAERYLVQTMRLASLLDRYLVPKQEINILSVDVEGLDLEVLRSSDWTRYRPEMVVVEHHEAAI
jgi:FkbM family methyltransferase